MSNIQQVNRRDFVKLIGLASGGILLGCNVSSSQKEFVPQEKGTFTPNLFIQIQKDGTITLLASRSEMGQGIRTSLASAIADEMEAMERKLSQSWIQAANSLDTGSSPESTWDSVMTRLKLHGAVLDDSWVSAFDASSLDNSSNI